MWGRPRRNLVKLLFQILVLRLELCDLRLGCCKVLLRGLECGVFLSQRQTLLDFFARCLFVLQKFDLKLLDLSLQKLARLGALGLKLSQTGLHGLDPLVVASLDLLQLCLALSYLQIFDPPVATLLAQLAP